MRHTRAIVWSLILCNVQYNHWGSAITLMATNWNCEAERDKGRDSGPERSHFAGIRVLEGKYVRTVTSCKSEHTFSLALRGVWCITCLLHIHIYLQQTIVVLCVFYSASMCKRMPACTLVCVCGCVRIGVCVMTSLTSLLTLYVSGEPIRDPHSLTPHLTRILVCLCVWGCGGGWGVVCLCVFISL